MENFKILTFNFLGVPFLSKNYHQRLLFLVTELSRIQPDVICLQEIWLPWARKEIINSLKNFGYQDFFYPKSEIRFSGLFIGSKYKILNAESEEIEPKITSLKYILSELFFTKGFSKVEIQLPNKETIFIFNVHLTNDFSNEFKKDSSYGRIQEKSLRKLAEEIDTLKEKKIIITGDFNFPADSWFYHYFLKLSGAKDITEDLSKETTENIFRFHYHINSRRLDYIFLKNFNKESIVSIKLFWSKPYKEFGYLSDHTALFAELKI